MKLCEILEIYQDEGIYDVIEWLENTMEKKIVPRLQALDSGYQEDDGVVAFYLQLTYHVGAVYLLVSMENRGSPLLGLIDQDDKEALEMFTKSKAGKKSIENNKKIDELFDDVWSELGDKLSGIGAVGYLENRAKHAHPLTWKPERQCELTVEFAPLIHDDD